MTNKEIVEQLESLKENSTSFLDDAEDEIWQKDIIALDRAIMVFKRKDKLVNKVSNKFLFILNIAIVITGIILTLGLVGDIEVGLASKQDTIFRAFMILIIFLLSITNIRMLWRGIGNE